MDTPVTPAGWYQDPEDSSRDRWWDGAQWHAQWRQRAPASPPPPPPPAQPASQPAGWYLDAQGANRYWDGQQWTGNVAPPPPHGATRPPAFWWALGGAVLMAVGAIGPWATALGVVDVSGTNGGDGWVVIVVAGVAVLGLFVSALRPAAIIALITALIGGAVGVVDLNDIESRGAAVQAAWGIYAVLAGSLVLLSAGLAQLAGSRR
jgi:hypothetical protein